jgi:hypothetical protein
MNCAYCGKYFEKGTSLGGHVPRCTLNPSFIKRHLKVLEKNELAAFNKDNCEHICECGSSFSSGQKLGGHRVLCKLNPNHEINKKKMILSQQNKTISESAKLKISKTILRKIENNEWHTSFSKSRTHEYKGIKFHGKWELNYAKFLDSIDVKWRRPTETFLYHFNGKNKRYTPDFYLIDSSEYIEIKGYPTDRDFCKWDQFPFELKIITGKDLHNLNLIDDYKPILKSYKDINWF